MGFGWFHNAWDFLPTRRFGRNAASNEPKSFLRRFLVVINYRRVIIKRAPSFLWRTFYRSLRDMSIARREKLDLSRPLVSRSRRGRRKAHDPISSTSFCRPSFSSFRVIIDIRARARNSLTGGRITVYHARAPLSILIPCARTCIFTQFVSSFSRKGWSSELPKWKYYLSRKTHIGTVPIFNPTRRITSRTEFQASNSVNSDRVSIDTFRLTTKVQLLDTTNHASVWI